MKKKHSVGNFTSFQAPLESEIERHEKLAHQTRSVELLRKGNGESHIRSIRWEMLVRE